MRKLVFFVFLPLFFFSCENKRQKNEGCNFQHDDLQLQVYNELLIELVEDQLYSLSFGNNISDTVSSKTIYLSYSSYHKELLGEIETALWKSHEPASEVREFLAKYGADSAAVLRNFNEAQQKYSAVDFQACTFKVGSLGEAKTFYELNPEQKTEAIGQVSFSEIHWNKQRDKGILYYEFYCGTKCGKGELIGFKKINGRWRISDSVQLWVS